MGDNQDLARGWMLKGDSDRLTARKLIDANGPFDTACFHTQQAIEKYLKSLLAYAAQPIPRTHNLEDIDRLCATAISSWQVIEIDLAKLTLYATQSRYDFTFWPDRRTAEEALDSVERVRSAVIAILPERAWP